MTSFPNEKRCSCTKSTTPPQRKSRNGWVTASGGARDCQQKTKLMKGNDHCDRHIAPHNQPKKGLMKEIDRRNRHNAPHNQMME